jgi:hypothetical protein
MRGISFLEWFLLGMPLELFVVGVIVSLVVLAVGALQSRRRKGR